MQPQAVKISPNQRKPFVSHLSDDYRGHSITKGYNPPPDAELATVLRDLGENTLQGPIITLVGLSNWFVPEPTDPNSTGLVSAMSL